MTDLGVDWGISPVEPCRGDEAAPRTYCDDLGGTDGEQPKTKSHPAQPKNGLDVGPFPAPQEATEASYVRTDISPDALFKAVGKLRREAADEIERLIAFLDEIGPAADLEPSGDELDADADSEPSMAAPEQHPDGVWWRRRAGVFRDRDGSQAQWGGRGNLDDREGDAGFDDREGDELQHGGESEREDHELSGDETEPSLGSFDRLTNQNHGWRQTAGNGRTWQSHCNSDFETDAAQ